MMLKLGVCYSSCMGLLPNEHQLTLSQYPDAKSMFAAIETRFGESLDSIFNRLQKIVSRLAILGVIIAQEDLKLKILSSLPPEWKHTMYVSDNTVYAFMVENLNGSNVLHQNLKKIHEDDLEAMNLKWQLSLLSVREKKWSVTTVISWDTLLGRAEHQEARKVGSVIP
ncbi:hypothetical protein Tco_0614770 [Tanacetum coccineum]